MATAESYTGGMITAACTDLAGSSQWFERGFVSDFNASKTELRCFDSDRAAVRTATVQHALRRLVDLMRA